MIVREGWLLKRGEHIKNWRARYFVLQDDGSFLGFKAKPNDGNYSYPTNKFTVRGCQIQKQESATHFIFIIRGLREMAYSDSNDVIERNFSAGNDRDRDFWCNAIATTALRLEAFDTFNQQLQAASNSSGTANLPMQIPLSTSMDFCHQLNQPLPFLSSTNTATNNLPTGVPAITSSLTTSAPPSSDVTSLVSTCGANSNNLALDASMEQPHREGGKKMSLKDFIPICIIGRGSWGKVMLSREKATQKLYAIKVLKKETIISQDEVGHTLTESRVLRTIQHPFIISLKYSFKDHERLYFVLEYALGGELFLHVSQARIFSEEKTRFYAAEIVSALGYLHENDIIYRDVKLENILLDHEGHIKIADFGLCKENITCNGTTRTFCGTPEYLSPEVIEDRRYGRAVDWWGLGVALYEMMCGMLPFNNRSTDSLFQEILIKQVTFPTTLTAVAKNFLNGLLIKDPSKRLGGGPDDAKEIQHHAFFHGLNWQDLLEKKIPPPFVPVVSSDTDTRYFDKRFTNEPPNLTPIDQPMNQSPPDQSCFNEFSFTAGGCSVLSQVHNLS